MMKDIDMKSLKEWSLSILTPNCVNCRVRFPEPLVVDPYDHKDGWDVAGFDEKQWLSVYCHNCGYDTSLNKIGVPRSLG